MKQITKLYLFFSLLIVSMSAFSQTCNDNIIASTPDSAFTVNDDGTVTHTVTGLMWKVCTEGQTWSTGNCLSTPVEYNWQAALQLPETLNASGGYAGHTGWRVPNIKELMSILEVKCFGPPINLSIFPATASTIYWTSSARTVSGGRFIDADTTAWVLNYAKGTIGTGLNRSVRDTSDLALRLVRSAP